MASWQVKELRHKLEYACRESQDQAAKVMGLQAAKLRAIKQATAAQQELNAVKIHLVETDAVL